MPFPPFRTDVSSGGASSDRSLSSSYSSSSYSNSAQYRRSERSSRPSPAPVLPQTTVPLLVRQPEPQSTSLPPMNLRVAVTPPPLLSLLPTPPRTQPRPLSDKHETLHLATNIDGDKNASLDTPAEAKLRNSTLHALTPSTIHALRNSRESPCIFRKVTPSDFANWEDLYPELSEASNIRYEYDGFTGRLIITCMAGSVHDSFPIFFTRVVNRGLDRVGPECQRALQIFASTDFHNFKGKYADTGTRKSPDAYIRVAGSRGFPSVVVEAGWAESMEDLMADANLWLLGTGRQTKVVIIVNFIESRDTTVSHCTPSTDSSPAADIDTDTDTDTDTADPTLDPNHPQTEEAILLSAVDSSTRLSTLSAALLDLHLRGALTKPLLGPITATLHVFRLSSADTVYEEFTTTVLPAPQPDDEQPPQSYALTLADMYGDTPLPAGEDPNLRFVMDMDDFRRDIAFQVPDMEEKRSIDRARAVLKKRDLWKGEVTFAGSKKAKRKRGDDGNADADYKDKKAR